VHVLREDHDLAACVGPDEHAAAEWASFAALAHVARGRWDPAADGPPAHGGHGLLILDGLLVRAVSFRKWSGVEVLGAGDLLRPQDEHESTFGLQASWRVLLDARLAVLDQRWSRRMAAFPEVGIALTDRAMHRSRRLAAAVAITQCRRLDVRPQLVLWSSRTASGASDSTASTSTCR
jgi:CRP/FNR family transcriptional regulator, cyclic AMP receptor protein